MRVWNRELMTSDFLGRVTEIFVFALILESWIPRIISVSLPFPWSQLWVGSSQQWFRLCSRFFSIIVHPPDTNRGTHLFRHHYKQNTLFFTENRVCRPQNTVHQHPGQAYPKCDLMFAQSGLTDSWTTPSIYTACARPILSFPQSKTEIQPQKDVTQDPGLSRCPHSVPYKGGIAMASRILGEADTHQSAWALTCDSHKYPDPAQFLVLFPSFGKCQGIFSLAGDMRVHPQPKRAKTWSCHEEGCGGWEDWELGIQRMINNKVLLKIIRKYINYPVINHMKKNKKKNIYFSMCITVTSQCSRT